MFCFLGDDCLTQLEKNVMDVIGRDSARVRALPIPDMRIGIGPPSPAEPAVPRTSAPETSAPGTSAPGTSAPGTAAPGTWAPGSAPAISHLANFEQQIVDATIVFEDESGKLFLDQVWPTPIKTINNWPH